MAFSNTHTKPNLTSQTIGTNYTSPFCLLSSVDGIMFRNIQET